MLGDDGLVFVTNYSPSPAAEASRARSQRWCWAHVWGWQWCACSRTIFSQTDNPYYCSGVYCFQQGNPGCKPARINYSLLSQSTFQTAIIFFNAGGSLLPLSALTPQHCHLSNPVNVWASSIRQPGTPTHGLWSAFFFFLLSSFELFFKLWCCRKARKQRVKAF